jgi:hypothetical protein
VPVTGVGEGVWVDWETLCKTVQRRKPCCKFWVSGVFSGGSVVVMSALLLDG